MKLYGGRKAIVGYVAPESHQKIERVAHARRVGITDLVVVATEWLADYLESPATAPTAPDISRLGVPPLPPAVNPNANSDAQTSASMNANSDAQSDVSLDVNSTQAARWLFERRGEFRHKRRKRRRSKATSATKQT
jgi:hypothetical protein